jgi:uncharacterized protein YjbI with pentapeptide repeats
MKHDYSGQDLAGAEFAGHALCGTRFRNAKLSGADFMGANLRGADFTNADLRKVRFEGAVFGRRRSVVVMYSIAAALVPTVLSCFTITFLTLMMGAAISRDSLPERIMWGVGALVAVLSISSFAQWGLERKLLTVLVPTTCIAVIAAVAGAHSVARNVASFLAGPDVVANALAVAGAGSIAGAGAVAVAGAAIVALAGYIDIRACIVGTLAGSSLGALAGNSTVASASAIVVVVLSSMIMRRVLRRHPGFEPIAALAVRVSSFFGTRFRGANCAEASFRGALVAQANFSGAVLTRVSWHAARCFSEAHFTDQNLRPRLTQQLVVEGNGRGQSLVRADLHDLNLANADLRDADLTEAICTGTDLTAAKLTGACLESWTIDPSTILAGVDCEYVYLLRQPINGDRKRRPADTARRFDRGEFADLYRRVINEIEVLLKKGIRPEGMHEALQEFSKMHPDVHLTKFENRDQAYVLGLELPPHELEREVEQDLRNLWHRLIQVETANRFLLEHNRDLKEIVLAARTATVKIGAVMVNKRDTIIAGDINISHSQVGSLSGDVDTSVQTLQANPDTRELATMLNALMQHIERSGDLNLQEKADAKEQVSVIARAVVEPSESTFRKAARLAFGFLRSLGQRIGEGAKLVEATEKLFRVLTDSGLL